MKVWSRFLGLWRAPSFRWGRWLVLILLFALLLQLACWRWLRVEQLVGDEKEYVRTAWLIVSEGHYLDDWKWLRPPLYPLYLAGVFLLFGLRIDLALLFQIPLNLASLVLLYLLGRRLFGETVGLVATALYAVYLPVVFYPTSWLLSENLALPLTLAIFYVLVRVEKDGITYLRMFWLGVLFGLASLARPMTFYFLPLVGLWLLIVLRGRLWPAIRYGVVLVLICLLTISPWVYRNYQVHHRLILLDTTGAQIFWYSNQPQGGDNEFKVQYLQIENLGDRQQASFQRALYNIRTHPGDFVRKMGVEALDEWRLELDARAGQASAELTDKAGRTGLLLLSDGQYLLLMALALYGLFASPRDRIWLLFLLWIAYVSFGIIVISHAELRYRLPMVPLFSLYAAYALVRKPWAQPGAVRRGVRWAGTVTLVLFLVATQLPFLVAGEAAGAAGALLGQQGHPGRAISLYKLATSVYPRDLDMWLTLGEMERSTGRLDEAFSAYGRVVEQIPYHAVARFARADILRARGDLAAAQQELEAMLMSPAELEAWAWVNFIPHALLTLDVGSGEVAEVGYIRDFYAAEGGGGATYRWTGAVSYVRLPLEQGERPSEVEIRMHGWRPPGQPPARVRIVLQGQEIAQIAAVSSDWREYPIPLPIPLEWGRAGVVLEIYSSTFVPSEAGMPEDSRTLGVAIDWVRLKTGP